MLALRGSQRKSASQCAPSILPCRIHHNGPTKITKRFWCPCTEPDGSKTAYFRGRRLRGRCVKLPAGYQGIATKPSERTLDLAKLKLPPEATYDEETDEQSEQEEELEPTEILDAAAKFDEIVVWGHDQMPAADDTFVKGVEEWITFAEAIHLPHSNNRDEVDEKARS